MRAAMVLAVFAMLPGAAMASGFYLPWWGEVLLFLLATPLGWACAALGVAVLVAGIVYAAKRWADGSTR